MLIYGVNWIYVFNSYSKDNNCVSTNTGTEKEKKPKDMFIKT